MDESPIFVEVVQTPDQYIVIAVVALWASIGPKYQHKHTHAHDLCFILKRTITTGAMVAWWSSESYAN